MVERLAGVPGVNLHTAHIIIAELGIDMTRFESAGHAASWSGLTPRAAVAVAHSILVIVYFLLRDGTRYQERGADYFDKYDRVHLERALVKRLEQLGNKVLLQPTAA